LTATTPATRAVSRRIAGVDWPAAEASLAERGFASTGPLLAARDCTRLAGAFSDDRLFRATVDLARHRFGAAGSYRYFDRPLPPIVETLRRELYPPLATIANHWQEALGREERYPDHLAGFLERCARSGQSRPTPLLLRYETGGYNCLHQDRYGAVAFPLQVVILLDRPRVDFEGGEFLLVEQRPRMQSRGSAVPLERGCGLVFPNTERPAQGTRGVYRVQTRHGVSEVTSGIRATLGIIFHDAT
jgi:hypothetical protein